MEFMINISNPAVYAFAIIALIIHSWRLMLSVAVASYMLGIVVLNGFGIDAVVSVWVLLVFLPAFLVIALPRGNWRYWVFSGGVVSYIALIIVINGVYKDNTVLPSLLLLAWSSAFFMMARALQREYLH